MMENEVSAMLSEVDEDLWERSDFFASVDEISRRNATLSPPWRWH
jgi:hypothetical protein